METKTTCASNVVTWSWTWRPVGWYDFSLHPTVATAATRSAGNSQPQVTYNATINACAKALEWQHAIHLFDRMSRPDDWRSWDTFTFGRSVLKKPGMPGTRSGFDFCCWRFRSGGNIHGYSFSNGLDTMAKQSPTKKSTRKEVGWCKEAIQLKQTCHDSHNSPWDWRRVSFSYCFSMDFFGAHASTCRDWCLARRVDIFSGFQPRPPGIWKQMWWPSVAWWKPAAVTGRSACSSWRLGWSGGEFVSPCDLPGRLTCDVIGANDFYWFSTILYTTSPNRMAQHGPYKFFSSIVF